jgi:putative spermidine/putrescine transport system substrate-binding protein
MNGRQMGRRQFLRHGLRYGTASAVLLGGGASLLAACGNEEQASGGNVEGGAEGSGAISSLGLSLTVDPRILRGFEQATGHAIDGQADTVGNMQVQWTQGAYRNTDILEPNAQWVGPIAANDLLRPVPVSEVPRWDDNVLPLFREPGAPGYVEASGWPLATIYTEEARENGSFDEFLMVPTWFGFDAFGYLTNRVTEGEDMDSYGLIFDERYAGRAALFDDAIQTPLKVATYLQGSGQYKFDGPLGNLTKEDLGVVFEFLAEMNARNQFRLLWDDFGQLVDLLVSEEIWVCDAWSSAIYAAQDQGAEARFVDNPTEGNNAWWYGVLVSPETEDYEAVIDYIDYWLGGEPHKTMAVQGYYSPRPDLVKPLIEDEFTTDPDVSDWDYWYGGATENRPSLESRIASIAEWQQYPDEFAEYSRLWTEFTTG